LTETNMIIISERKSAKRFIKDGIAIHNNQQDSHGRGQHSVRRAVKAASNFSEKEKEKSI